MTATTVSQAVQKRDEGPAELVRQSRPWFATIVPSHIDAQAFVAMTIGYLRRQPKLAAAAGRNPASFMAALSECARLGLVPGDTFHLVPFEDRRNGTVEITGITDYTGEIELIYRAGAVASVKAEIVCRRDLFRFTTDMDRPEHAPDWFGERGDLIGAYAYAVMKDGATSKVIVYSKGEIDKVRAVSKTGARDDSPWGQWYDRMALKTVLHRLAHFVPTSAEYRREQLRAAAEVAQSVNAAAPSVNGVPAQAAAEPVYEAEVVGEHEDPGPAAPDETPASGPAAGPGPVQRPPKPSKAAADKLTRLLKQIPLGDEKDVATFIGWLTGHSATEQLTTGDVKALTTFLEDALEHAGGDTAEAAHQIWTQHKRATGKQEPGDG
jgi:recombination protein RecT